MSSIVHNYLYLILVYEGEIDDKEVNLLLPHEFPQREKTFRGTLFSVGKLTKSLEVNIMKSPIVRPTVVLDFPFSVWENPYVAIAPQELYYKLDSTEVQGGKLALLKVLSSRFLPFEHYY